MQAETSDQIFEKLDELLDEERLALLQGDFDAVSGLSDRKERLLDQLGKADRSGLPKVDGLRAKTLRNQALLEAALEGIRTVTERLSALRRVRDTLETYDGQGRKTAVPSPALHKVEKRA